MKMAAEAIGTTLDELSSHCRATPAQPSDINTFSKYKLESSNIASLSRELLKNLISGDYELAAEILKQDKQLRIQMEALTVRLCRMPLRGSDIDKKEVALKALLKLDYQKYCEDFLMTHADCLAADASNEQRADHIIGLLTICDLLQKDSTLVINQQCMNLDADDLLHVALLVHYKPTTRETTKEIAESIFIKWKSIECMESSIKFSRAFDLSKFICNHSGDVLPERWAAILMDVLPEIPKKSRLLFQPLLGISDTLCKHANL